jgi:chorismate mutase
MTEDLLRFRRELDELDNQLIDVLARRLAVCRKVALHKIEAGIPVMQADRVTEVKARAASEGKTKGLAADFVLSLYDILINEACRIEDEITATVNDCKRR